MDHSYEHIRKTTIGIITNTRGGQFDILKQDVAEALKEGEGRIPAPGAFIYQPSQTTLSTGDSQQLVEVFWDLFREGIITLGADADHPNFPWFQASRLFDEKIQKER